MGGGEPLYTIRNLILMLPSLSPEEVVMHPSTAPSPASLHGSISFNSSFHQLITTTRKALQRTTCPLTCHMVVHPAVRKMAAANPAVLYLLAA
ncbi:hypothetical protein EYF80_021205 [Liparis tanakae]|uniref:Uncharacterized protein n=1 Tax=Liparis tanakae TaxID=230148 RepID=A0A4Z2HRT7_9TELE|nr:hypothetical protein EYF80_021205 [Liparis tanakae]